MIHPFPSFKYTWNLTGTSLFPQNRMLSWEKYQICSKEIIIDLCRVNPPYVNDIFILFNQLIKIVLNVVKDIPKNK